MKGDLRKNLRRGVYVIPTSFTILNLFFGFRCIVNSMRGIQAITDGRTDLAIRFFEMACQSLADIVYTVKPNPDTQQVHIEIEVPVKGSTIVLQRWQWPRGTVWGSVFRSSPSSWSWATIPLRASKRSCPA